MGYGRSDRYGDRGGYGYVEPMGKPNAPITNFEKNFLRTNSEMSPEDVEKFRTANEMKITGNNIPAPSASFRDCGFDRDVVDYFENQKRYEKPTSIQAQGWPMALSGRDMIGIAATGSGKTLSFLLPAFTHAAAQPALRPNDGPIAVVLAPTRELATQIETVANELCRLGCFRNIRSHCVYGGASAGPQKKALREGVEILVATPGRLIDLHKQGFCPLGRTTFLVLDEADRMLDMGFEPQLNEIVPQTNPGRQTLMWSATWPKEVKELAYRYTSRDAIQVVIGSEELEVNKKIVQNVEVVSVHDKMKKLLYILQDYRAERVLIFCNRKMTCDRLERELRRERFGATALHGDKSQGARDAIFDNFKRGRDPVLIATDVAARGLDVKEIRMVVNYDLPHNLEDYVHRVGRTARGSEEKGYAYTMFSPEEDSTLARKFIEILKKSNVEIPREMEEIAQRSGGSSRSRYDRYSRGRGGYSSGRTNSRDYY
ncbi:ATP dep RNA helicase [Enterospora canceri]|uniref:RNA helicase n=1 Tax=Enterospora canceri TaxID=1081671 RepID=A0A1Y1S5X9_9MICR|nr:ATP dep RNA helicase [Enterospora canceri]